MDLEGIEVRKMPASCMSNEFIPFTIITQISVHSEKGKMLRIMIRKKQT